MNRIQSILLALMILIAVPCRLCADAVGTWKLYPCYTGVTEIEPTGTDIFVLACGNLYSYNVSDNSLTEYSKLNGLSSNEITHITWVPQAKRLVVTYSDYSIDLISLTQSFISIPDLKDKLMTGDKTINDIYVSGKYVYLSTGFGIIKINVSEGYIADTYNLGYSINYCYIEGGYIHAQSQAKGNMRALMTDNLQDTHSWTCVGGYTAKTKDKYVQDTHNNCYWAADEDSKLTKYQKQNGTYTPVSTGVNPDGPNTNYAWRLAVNKGTMYCADGAYSIETAGANNHPGNVKVFDRYNWTNFEKNIVTEYSSDYKSAQCVVLDPTNSNHVYVGSYRGLYEFYGGRFSKAYNRTSYADPNGAKSMDIIASMCMDKDNSLWLVGYGSPYIAKLKDGVWTKYNHSDLLTGKFADCNEGMLYDSRGLIWFCSTRYEYGRLFCYNPTTDVLTRCDNFINQDGTSYTPWMRNISEDNNGNIWVATNIGPFYITDADIRNNSMIMTQHKVPRNDGTNYADYLLTNIDCTCIRVDNANRKWIGTAANGVYVISSDCNTEIHHFTSSNSDLPSDFINDLQIDEVNSIVYIATAKGLCSYQSDSSVPSDDMNPDTAYAYPNPVTPDFTGLITITGLAAGSQIKILSASGNLVNQGNCLGGVYQWNGCDLHGNKVASGVYMVNVATPEGNKGIVTKIGIVR